MNDRKRYTVPLPGGRSLELGTRTLIMGVINVTPDSFADGGVRFDPERAIEDGLRMVAQGADILDVGGESTRPGAAALDAREELRRVLPVVERLAAAGASVSIDTYKAVVAREAVARGAVIVNDISALQFDHELGDVVARTGAAVVLMHNRGRSDDMYRHADYLNAPLEIAAELRLALARTADAGIRIESTIVDPGLGFAKRAAHSYAALAHLATLAALDRPILSGPSRKSFLKEAIGDRVPAAREWGTAAAVAASVLLGAHIVRVHGVEAMLDVVRVADRIRSAAESPGRP
ncbi:MAG: dihydropteroate synthase [Acidobacteriota bacterium]|jgi:dihydropteroate synthase